MITGPTSKRRARNERRGAWGRRWVATAGLVAFLLATSGMLPLLVAAVASADTDHRVNVSGFDGGVNVVLKHEGGRQAAHAHCVVSRMLVFFEQPPQANPDHVLHFTTGGNFLRESPPAVPSPDAPELEPVFPEISLFELAFVPVPAPAPSPPAPPGALAGVRTTLLLI